MVLSLISAPTVPLPLLILALIDFKLLAVPSRSVTAVLAVSRSRPPSYQIGHVEGRFAGDGVSIFQLSAAFGAEGNFDILVADQTFRLD